LSLNIVLIEPEIPQNTGNIARTCAGLGAKLHLVEPFGFSISNRYLKRAGLDYWDNVNIKTYKDFADFLDKNINIEFYLATTKAVKDYTEIHYRKDTFIVFGSETRGISEDILKKYKERCIRIPMKGDIRSLNLSNAVAIIAYEAYRQNDFFDLEKYKKDSILDRGEKL
jgi:tRNA (cytidine/uridine-2'-O-)-methyltransferase